jgi:hypothetical protein
MRVECQSCKRSGIVDPCRWAGRSGPLMCFYCGRLISVVDVSRWRKWIAGYVQIKKEMQKSGQLHTRKQSLLESDSTIDSDGIAGELAACLLLCPGFLREWQESAENGGNNRGRDLIALWTGLPKSVEVKFTKYQDDRNGYLLIRPPSGTGAQMCNDFVDDAIYVLVQPKGQFHSVSGWIDRHGFLSRKVEDPVPSNDGQTQCWGVHWQKLSSLEQLPEPKQANFAVLPMRSGAKSETKPELWYGFSEVDGWVVINWLDSRNMLGKSPRYLHMLRIQDDAEVRVSFDEWRLPRYKDARQHISEKHGAECDLLEKEFTALHGRIGVPSASVYT